MEISRKNKLKLNIITTLMYQFTNIVSGFILPNYFLRYYGSQVNGLISSITQFLAVISLCECGVGAVIQATLYKPIAQNDEYEISRIFKSSTKFFNKISIMLIGYMVLLIIIFPILVNKNFSLMYIGILIFSITISMLAQYYFAVTYKLILNAAQLSYVQMGVSTVTLVLNVILSVLLMKLDFSVQAVKLVSSIIFLIQPLIYKIIVDRKFKIQKNIILDDEPIKQKWNGLAQHIAMVVLENTDVLVLTFFSSLSNISIYAIYHLVTNGIKLVFTSIANSMKSLLGDMYARRELKLLDKTFTRFEYLTHISVTVVYTITSVLIVPFVSVYTKDVCDANYILPLFGILMSLAMAIYTIRLPYNQIVSAVGHFKETQNSAILEAVLNLTVSIILVSKYGLIGVAIGTIIAVLYRTLYFVWYLSKHILKRNVTIFIKLLIMDLCLIACIYLSTHNIYLASVTYLQWFIMAAKVCIISLIDTGFVVLIFFKIFNIKFKIKE